MCSHFHCGTGSGCKSPDGFWWSAFTCWQVKHLDTYSAISRFIPSHQKFLFKSWYIFVPPGCTVNRDLCASSRISFLRLSILGTHSLSLHLSVPSALIVYSFGSFAATLANHCWKFASYFCASSTQLMIVGCTIRHPKCRSFFVPAPTVT